ncbi:unnamed protein product [Caretta caretta]
MMLLRCVCILVWCSLPGSVAAISLTQPSSALAKPGSSVTLDCVASGYNINDHHMHWTRQTQGKGLVWIAAFKTGDTTYISNDFKGRVTPSTSGSTARLRIDKLTAADTATYYCSRHSDRCLTSSLTISPWNWPQSH